MGGFVPDCHTQTSVKVAKLEWRLPYALAFVVQGRSSGIAYATKT